MNQSHCSRGSYTLKLVRRVQVSIATFRPKSVSPMTLVCPMSRTYGTVPQLLSVVADEGGCHGDAFDQVSCCAVEEERCPSDWIAAATGFRALNRWGGGTLLLCCATGPRDIERSGTVCWDCGFTAAISRRITDAIIRSRLYGIATGSSLHGYIISKVFQNQRRLI